ncbi:hypothetical protein BJX99DRAFT_84815 [Aspergillus californicus]
MIARKLVSFLFHVSLIVLIFIFRSLVFPVTCRTESCKEKALYHTEAGPLDLRTRSQPLQRPHCLAQDLLLLSHHTLIAVAVSLVLRDSHRAVRPSTQSPGFGVAPSGCVRSVRWMGSVHPHSINTWMVPNQCDLSHRPSTILACVTRCLSLLQLRPCCSIAVISQAPGVP